MERILAKWSCDDFQNGACRNAHGCHCAEIQILSERNDELRKAVRRLKRADTETSRADNSGEPVRINKAGTAYAMAKINLFNLVR